MARTYDIRFADGTVLRDLFSSNLHHLATQGRLDMEDEVRLTGSEVWFPAWKVNGLFEEAVLTEFRNRGEAIDRLRNARTKGRLNLQEYRQERDSLLLLQGGAIRETKWAVRSRGPDSLIPEPKDESTGERIAQKRAGGVVDMSEPGSGVLAGVDDVLILDDPLDLAGYLRNYLSPQALWGSLDRVTAGLVVAIVPVLVVLDICQPAVDGVAALLMGLAVLMVFTCAVAAFSRRRRYTWGAWIAPLFWGTVLTTAALLVQLSVGPQRGVMVKMFPGARRLQESFLGVARQPAVTPGKSGAGSR